MRKALLGLMACVLLLAGSGCKKTSAADAVTGTWSATSTYYQINSISPCNRTINYTQSYVAVVSKVNDNTIVITINGGSRTVTFNGNSLTENANNSDVGYYGQSTDQLTWTLSGNTLKGIINGNSCGEFEVTANKIN